MPPKLLKVGHISNEDDMWLVESLHDSLEEFVSLEPASEGAITPAIAMLGRLLRVMSESTAPKMDQTVMENVVATLEDGGMYPNF